MRSENWNATDDTQKKEASIFQVFRLRRHAQPDRDELTSPFTEPPEELKHSHFSFGSLVRKFFNFLFLLLLGLALLALILAYAYQMIYHPDVLQAWASGLVSSVQDFIQQLTAPAQ